MIARAFAGANEVLIAPIFRSKLPEPNACRCLSWCATFQVQGLSAREADRSIDIVAGIAREHRPRRSGVDVERRIFGGIHQKLLRALA
jgi:hypothetical protein